LIGIIRIPALILIVALGGCATPSTSLPTASHGRIVQEKHHQILTDLQLELHRGKQLAKISHDLLSANIDLCPDNRAVLAGFIVWSKGDLRKDRRIIAQQAFHVGARPTVLAVVPNSPAALAGLLPGDRIYKIGASTAPKVGKGQDWLISKWRNSIKPGRQVNLTVQRDGQFQVVRFIPRAGCGYRVRIADTAKQNAFTDGHEIVLTRGLLDFTPAESDIATVFAHELAHVVMGHRDKKVANAMVGGVGGLAVDIALAVAGVNTGGAFAKAGIDAGAVAYSQDFEREADYVGLYLLARSGYQTEASAGLWRRIAKLDPRSITYAGTHPTTAERFVQMQITHDEIAAKKAANAPLVPNPRKRRPGNPAAARPSIGPGV